MPSHAFVPKSGALEISGTPLPKDFSKGSFSSQCWGRRMLHPQSFIDPFTLVLLGLHSREAQRIGPLCAATKLFGSISDRTILLYPIQRVLELCFVLF